MTKYSLALALAPLLALVACAAPTGEETTSASESDLSVAELLRVKGVVVQLNADQNGFNIGAAYKHRPGRPATCKRQQRIGLTCLANIDCDNTPAAPDPGVTGRVLITGGASPITLTPENGFFDYVITPPPAPAFILPGAPVHVDSTASFAAPFTLDGKMPARIAVTTPAIADANQDALTVAVDRSKPLSVAWTGGDAWVDVQIISGTVQIDAAGAQGDATTITTLDCLVPAVAHRAVVPAAALAVFSASDSVGFGYRNLGKPGTTAHMNTITVTSEAHKLGIAAGGNGADLAELITTSSVVQSDLLNLK